MKPPRPHHLYLPPILNKSSKSHVNPPPRDFTSKFLCFRNGVAQAQRYNIFLIYEVNSAIISGMKKYWLIKSEPDCYSIDDLKEDKQTAWSGVRNYQARNFMKDMTVGDLALFWHSGANPPHSAGVAKVTKSAYPDKTAQDKNNDHHDPKSTKENPIWFNVEFGFVQKFKNIISLSQIKFNPKLEGIMVAQRGSRLSIQPVSKAHFEVIQKLGN